MTEEEKERLRKIRKATADRIRHGGPTVSGMLMDMDRRAFDAEMENVDLEKLDAELKKIDEEFHVQHKPIAEDLRRRIEESNKKDEELRAWVRSRRRQPKG